MAKPSALVLRCNASLAYLHDRLVARFADQSFPDDILLKAKFTNVKGTYVPFVAISGNFDATFTQNYETTRRVAVGIERDPMFGPETSPPQFRPVYGEVRESHSVKKEITHRDFSVCSWVSSAAPNTATSFLDTLPLQDNDFSTGLEDGFFVADVAPIGRKDRDSIVRRRITHRDIGGDYSNLCLLIDPATTVVTYYYPIWQVEFQYREKTYVMDFDAFRNQFIGSDIDGDNVPKRQTNPRVVEIYKWLDDWKQAAYLYGIPAVLCILFIIILYLGRSTKDQPGVITLGLFSVCIVGFTIYCMIDSESRIVSGLSPTLRRLRAELARLSADDLALRKSNIEKFKSTGGRLVGFMENRRTRPENNAIDFSALPCGDDEALVQKLGVSKEVTEELMYLMDSITVFRNRLMDTKLALHGKQPESRERDALMQSLNDENNRMWQLWGTLNVRHGPVLRKNSGGRWREMVDIIGLNLEELNFIMKQVADLLGKS
jgi:hypothetical protein